MPDLSEQLSSILQNPQAQDSIRQLMGMLSLRRARRLLRRKISRRLTFRRCLAG